MPAHIAAFAFNRPEHLRRTLSALADNDLAAESALTIFCDGPLAGKAAFYSIDKYSYINFVKDAISTSWAHNDVIEDNFRKRLQNFLHRVVVRLSRLIY